LLAEYMHPSTNVSIKKLILKNLIMAKACTYNISESNILLIAQFYFISLFLA